MTGKDPEKILVAFDLGDLGFKSTLTSFLECSPPRSWERVKLIPYIVVLCHDDEINSKRLQLMKKYSATLSFYLYV